VETCPDDRPQHTVVISSDHLEGLSDTLVWMATPSGSSIVPSFGLNPGTRGKQFTAGITVYSAKTPSTGGVPQKRTPWAQVGMPVLVGFASMRSPYHLVSY